MQIVFGSGVATGRFSMGSSEAFGRPVDFNTTETQSDMTDREEVEFVEPFKTPDSQKIMDSTKSNESSKGAPINLGKRKCVAEEDHELMIGLAIVVNNVAENLIQPVKDDRVVYVELYHAVMGLPSFTEETLMFALSHKLDNKSQGFNFLEMTEAHMVLWLRTFLSKHYY
jgi:hypothetical protein